MKKFLSVIALTLFTSTQALASVPYGTTSIYNEPNFDIEIQIANTDNSISTLLNGYIDLMTTVAASEFNEKELQISNLFLEEIKGKNMQINVQNSGYWFQVEQSNTDFQNLLSEIKTITPVKSETAGPTTAHEFRFGDMAFANINGKLVLSSTNKIIFLHDEEITAENISLDNNEVLSFEGSFDNEEFTYSLSENNGLITSSSMAELPSLINDTNFNTTNHLYQDIKAENPAVYFEITQLLNLILGSYPQELQTSLEQELAAEFGEDLPSYESIFNKQTAFLVDLNETIIPEFTIAMADVTSTEADEIIALINEIVPEEVNNSNFTVEFTDINSNLKKVTVTPTTENVEADILNIEEIVITYGLYEGNFIFTNNPNVLTESKTLADNISFSNSHAASKANVGAISYIDFATIAEQISIYEDELSRLDDSFVSEVPSAVEEILTEMGIWSGYSYIANNKLLAESQFKLPADLLLEQLETLVDNEDSFFTSYNYNPYSDVNEDVWYYDEISQAYELYIIDTFDYETETYSYDFKPAKEITRGEFVQMIVAAYELEYEDISQYGSDIFSDVDSDSYFDYAIGVAYEKGIIQGDDDANTFRPNDTLNRAEAVQILYNASPLLQGKESSTNNFIDVPQDAWYKNVVSVAVQESIVKGINPEEFAPSKNLNKAEAVTLLIRLVNNEVRF